MVANARRRWAATVRRKWRPRPPVLASPSHPAATTPAPKVSRHPAKRVQLSANPRPVPATPPLKEPAPAPKASGSAAAGEPARSYRYPMAGSPARPDAGAEPELRKSLPPAKYRLVIMISRHGPGKDVPAWLLHAGRNGPRFHLRGRNFPAARPGRACQVRRARPKAANGRNRRSARTPPGSPA